MKQITSPKTFYKLFKRLPRYSELWIDGKPLKEVLKKIRAIKAI